MARPDLYKDLKRRRKELFEEGVRVNEVEFARFDRDLWARAERAKGHISPEAVEDEYARLIHEKLHPWRTLWSRIFFR